MNPQGKSQPGGWTDERELIETELADRSRLEDREESTPRPVPTPLPLPDRGDPPAAANKPALNWQNVIWREWRNCDDEEYARHLFDLVAGEPVGRATILIAGLMGALYGGLAGWLVKLIGMLGESPAGGQTSLPGLVWIGAALGGGIGLLASLLLRQPLSWRTWLARLTFNMTPGELGLVGLGLIFVLFGGLAGWLVGWLAGLGHVVGIIMLAILLAGGLGTGLVSWLLGLEREPNPSHLHQYRTGWFWWRDRPHRAEVEAALKQACQARPAAQAVWADVLQTLAQGLKQPDSPQKLMARWQSQDWAERFTAVHLLPALGGEAVTHLQPIAARKSSPLWRKAVRLLQSIGQETTTHLAHRATNLLCPRCLTRFGPHSVTVSEEISFTYYGCRTCGQSRAFLEGEVVATLAAGMGAEPVQQAGIVRVNWLSHRTPFDFDRVEIIQATDEEVERFAVQVGNDTDPVRRSRYKQMPCLVAPRCQLSENTLRILQHTFGQVDSQR